MSSRSRTSVVAAVVLASTALAGCSEYYFDRRDGVSLASGEALAANRIAHAIDPWPPASANRNIAYSGDKMQVAAERYRTGRIIPPVNATTSSAAYQGSSTSPPALAGNPAPASPK